MKVAVVVLTVLAALPVFAQGVQVKKAWDSANQEIASEVAAVKEKCGLSIKASADQKSFGNDLEVINTASWCKNTVSAMTRLCDSDADYKAAMKKVTAVECKYNAGLKPDEHYGNKFEMKGGTLVHSYNKSTANIDSEAYDYLKAHL